MRVPQLALTALLFLPVTASAAGGNVATVDEEEELGERAPPNISPDLLDLSGRSRFHLTSRVTFDDGTKAFSGSSLWSFEAQAAVRLTRGLALAFNLPFGLYAPDAGVAKFFFGNFRVGAAGGYAFEVIPSSNKSSAGYLGFGGAFDVYVPVLQDADQRDCIGVCAPAASVRGLRAYEPFGYMERTMSFRTRVAANFGMRPFDAQLELGLTPAFTTRADSNVLVFFSWALRGRVYPIYEIEPYLEIGNNLQIAGPNLAIVGGAVVDQTTPVMLTLGARGHLGVADPALFLSFDLKNGVVIFGLDLAGAVRDIANRDTEVDPLDFPSGEL
jgi:hypothetical protein